jgi:hypothetical protein
MQQTGVAEANKRQGRGKDAIKRSLFSYFPPSPLLSGNTHDTVTVWTRFAINDLSSNDLTIWGMKLYAVYTLTFDVGIEFLLAQCVYACTAEHAAEECCCDLSSGTHSHAGTP